MRNLPVLFHVDFKFLQFLCLLDKFVTDPAATDIRALWSSDGVLVLFRLRGGESTTAVSLQEQLVFVASIWFNSFYIWCTIYAFMLTELNEVLNRLTQRPSQNSYRIGKSETSGDETDTRNGRREILTKKIFLFKKGVRGDCAWQVLRDRTIRHCQYAQPFFTVGRAG